MASILSKVKQTIKSVTQKPVQLTPYAQTKLKELGVSNKLTPYANQRLIELGGPKKAEEAAKKAIANTPKPPAPPKTPTGGGGGSSSGGSSSKSVQTIYSDQRKKDEERYSSLSKSQQKLIDEENKKAAEAEKRAAEERARLIGAYDTTGQALIDRMSSLESPDVAYSRIAGEEKLDEANNVTKGLREQIDRINKQLKGVEENVNARSMNSGLTEAQRQRLVMSEEDPLRTQLTDLTGGLNSAVANVDVIRTSIRDRLAAFAAGQEQSLAPLREAVGMARDKIGFELPEISERLSREITRYSTERQSKLDVILAKFSRDEALDDAELAEASQLAREERAFVQQQDLYNNILAEAGASGGGVTGAGTTQNLPSLDDIFGGGVGIQVPSVAAIPNV